MQVNVIAKTTTIIIITGCVPYNVTVVFMMVLPCFSVNAMHLILQLSLMS